MSTVNHDPTVRWREVESAMTGRSLGHRLTGDCCEVVLSTLGMKTDLTHERHAVPTFFNDGMGHTPNKNKRRIGDDEESEGRDGGRCKSS